MALVKWDVSGSDPEKATRVFEPPSPGMYIAVTHEVKLGYKDNDKKQPRLEIIYKILKATKGDDPFKHKGAYIYEYIGFGETQQWKMDQFMQALGFATKKKRKGQTRTEDMQGQTVRLQVKAGKNANDEYRGDPGGVWAAADDDLDDIEESDIDDSDEDLEDDEDEDEEEDDSGDDEDEEDEDESEEDESESYTLPELEELDKADLLELAGEWGVKPPVAAKKKAQTLAEWLFDNQPNPPDGEEEDEEDSDEDNYDDTDEWTLAKLRAEVKERELTLPKGAKRQQLVDILREDDGEEPF